MIIDVLIFFSDSFQMDIDNYYYDSTRKLFFVAEKEYTNPKTNIMNYLENDMYEKCISLILENYDLLDLKDHKQVGFLTIFLEIPEEELFYIHLRGFIN